jgi:lactobin A/cerein 7B family class IIb bacteriocin
MKKLNFEQMEGINGGWKPKGWALSVEQHALCAIIGFGSASCSFGAGAAFGYLGCVALLATSGDEEVIEWEDTLEEE